MNKINEKVDELDVRLDLLNKHLTSIEFHDEPKWFPRGAWHKMESNPDSRPDEVLSAPFNLIHHNLRRNFGTYLELFAGAGHYAQVLAKETAWSIYITDIHATKFKSYQDLIDGGINVYELGIESIIKNDLPAKVDVIASFNAFVQPSKTAAEDALVAKGNWDYLYDNPWNNLMNRVEQWISRNTEYLITNGTCLLDTSYAQQKCVYSNNPINAYIIDTIDDISLIKFKQER